MISYDEPAHAYHASRSIGSGDIRDFIRSPRLFRDSQDGIQTKQTEAMAFGGLAHMAILEPIRFTYQTIAKPAGMSFATKEGKAWRSEQRSANLTIVDSEDRETVTRMLERMPTEIERMLHGGHAEVTVRTSIGSLDVQCRPDYWIPDRNTKYDLKTISAIESIERAIFKYSYHIQDRWYNRVILAETGRKTTTSAFLFVETNAPYRWRIVELDLDYILMADQAIDRALAGIEARTKSGCWEDPADIHLMASPPAWAAEDDDSDNDEGT